MARACGGLLSVILSLASHSSCLSQMSQLLQAQGQMLSPISEVNSRKLRWHRHMKPFEQARKDLISAYPERAWELLTGFLRPPRPIERPPRPIDVCEVCGESGLHDCAYCQETKKACPGCGALPICGFFAEHWMCSECLEHNQ